MRRWCEHGYTTAFDKTQAVLSTHFVNLKTASDMAAAAAFTEVEEPVSTKTEEIEAPKVETARFVYAPPRSNISPAFNALFYTLCRVTLGDKPVDLIIYEGQTAEDAVIALCRKNDQEHEISACIRHLLPLGKVHDFDLSATFC